MKKKHEHTSENYLDKRPSVKEGLKVTISDSGAVTIETENTGFMNRAAQKLLKKPKISYIHLDETGSFVWRFIDGESDILKIGKLVKERFGDEAEPLYERLAAFFASLKSCDFIEYK